MKNLAALLQRASQELDKRNLTDIRTERLLEMVLRVKAELISEVGEVSKQYQIGDNPMGFDPSTLFTTPVVCRTALE